MNGFVEGWRLWLPFGERLYGNLAAGANMHCQLVPTQESHPNQSSYNAGNHALRSFDSESTIAMNVRRSEAHSPDLGIR